MHPVEGGHEVSSRMLMTLEEQGPSAGSKGSPPETGVSGRGNSTRKLGQDEEARRPKPTPGIEKEGEVNPHR